MQKEILIELYKKSWILIIINLDFDFIINKISQKKFKLEFELSSKHINVGTIISDFDFF
jgi:hypothetical protein